MREKTYLIPANTKKGQLILNLFLPIDLIILGVGLCLSFVLLLIMGTNTTLITILVLVPGLLSSFLVLPIPHYHNVFQFFKSMYMFLTNQRIYRWKGWCFYESTNDEK